MNPKPIQTKSEHNAALAEVEWLMSAKARTLEGERLDQLVTLIEAYERTHFSIDLPHIAS